MSYPLIIACEMSSFEEDAFPVAIAWNLADGSIKTTLIRPEEEWLENADHLEVDPDQLLIEGHSAKAVLQELQLDREDEPLYCFDPYPAEQALEQLYSCLDSCNDLPVLPLMDLLDEVDYDQLEACREDCLMELELDPQRADEQVRLWLEVYARLTS